MGLEGLDQRVCSSAYEWFSDWNGGGKQRWLFGQLCTVSYLASFSSRDGFSSFSFVFVQESGQSSNVVEKYHRSILPAALLQLLDFFREVVFPLLDLVLLPCVAG